MLLKISKQISISEHDDENQNELWWIFNNSMFGYIICWNHRLAGARVPILGRSYLWLEIFKRWFWPPGLKGPETTETGMMWRQLKSEDFPLHFSKRLCHNYCSVTYLAFVGSRTVMGRDIWFLIIFTYFDKKALNDPKQLWLVLRDDVAIGLTNQALIEIKTCRCTPLDLTLIIRLILRLQWNHFRSPACCSDTTTFLHWFKVWYTDIDLWLNINHFGCLVAKESDGPPYYKSSIIPHFRHW